jgi:hypothetical protein
MDDQRLQTTLNELLSEIGSSPESDRAGLDTLSHQTRERPGELKQTVTNVQGSMDYLRLSIKYLVFDLEATRRENAHLRQMLEEEPGA